MNDLESRVADLRHVGGRSETIRQAHYAAGDQVNQARAWLYEATAEVGQAGSRNPLRGRRPPARGAAPAPTGRADPNGQARKGRADAELENLAGAGADAEERAELLAAQLEEQAMQLPTWKTPCARPRPAPASSAPVWCRCSSKSRCWPPSSAAWTKQSRQLDTRDACAPTERPGRARRSPPEQPAQPARSRQESRPNQRPAWPELRDTVPQLDEDRRARQQDVNTENARQTDLSARLEALKALQEKVKTDGKLQPGWQRHGLDGLQGLWSRIHIEPGWENALEAALRERLGALEVGPPGHGARLLGSNENDAPPARLAFYSAPAAGVPEPTGAARLSDLLRIHDASLRAVLTDWLQGCSIAQRWTTP